MTKAQLTTGIQRAVQLHAVPPGKFSSMLARTVIGTVFVLVGVGLLYGMVRVYIRTDALSLPLLAMGGGFLLVGAHIWSSQLINASALAVLGFFRVVFETVRGKNGAT